MRARPFLDSPKDNSTIYVKLGQNKTVECLAYAQGNIHFQLLRITKNHSANGTDVIEVMQKPTDFSADYASDADVVRRNRVAFHFNNITKKDLGLYTCMAGNSVGFAAVSFNLRQDPAQLMKPTNKPGLPNAFSVIKCHFLFFQYCNLSDRSNFSFEPC